MGVREDLPEFIDPMLPAAAELPATSEGLWATELKWDGLRAQVRVDSSGAVKIRSRTGRDITRDFPDVATIAGVLRGRRVLLDGELVCLADGGLPDFTALRRRLARRAGGPDGQDPVTFVAFDLLHLDGRASRPMSFERRRAALVSLELDGPHWHTPAALLAPPGELASATEERGLEGVVAKRLDSAYRPGRSHAWIVCSHRETTTWRVVAWAPGGPDEADVIWFGSRADAPAGVVRIGPGDPDREALREALEGREDGAHPRGGRCVGAGVELDVSGRVRDGGTVEDAVLRAWRTA